MGGGGAVALEVLEDEMVSKRMERSFWVALLRDRELVAECPRP